MVLFILYRIFFVAGVVALNCIFFVAGVVVLMLYGDEMCFIKIALCVAIILFSALIIYSLLVISRGGGVVL